MKEFESGDSEDVTVLEHMKRVIKEAPEGQLIQAICLDDQAEAKMLEQIKQLSISSLSALIRCLEMQKAIYPPLEAVVAGLALAYLNQLMQKITAQIRQENNDE